MVDYAIDSTFDIYFTEENKFAVANDRKEFEDDLSIALDEQLSQYIGQRKSTANLKQRVKLLATRFVNESNAVESVASVRVTETPLKSTSIALEITYRTGETFEETL